MDEHHAIPYLREVVIFLVAAAILVPAMRRLRVSPILGFLFGGLLLGPHGLATFSPYWPSLDYVVITDLESVRRLAELGVVFLLFSIGLELSVQRLLSMRRLVLGLGSAQVMFCGLVIAAVALAWDNTPTAALVYGFAFALSSTAIVVPTLIERGEFGSRSGRAVFAVLLMQDVAVAPIVTIVSVLGQEGGASPGLTALIAFGKAILAIAAIAAFGRYLLRPLFRLAAGARSRELFMAMVLLTVIVTAMATGLAGLSMALGAFLGGLVLAETEYRAQVEVELEPFKGLLLGLFFFSVGMGIDPVAVYDVLDLALLSVVGLLIVKGLLITGLARAFGLPFPVAANTGLALAASGEFVFVIVGLAISLDLVPYGDGQFMLIVASLSLVLAPFMVAAGAAVRRRLDARARAQVLDHAADEAADVQGHVVIAGFGRVGQTVAQILVSQETAYVAIDRDAERVVRLRRGGAPVMYGDAAREEILERAGLTRATALVITLDDVAAARRALDAAKRMNPSCPIYLRARDGEDAELLRAAGADHVVPETIESSLQLAGAVVNALGVPRDAVNELIEEIRRRDYGDVSPPASAPPSPERAVKRGAA